MSDKDESVLLWTNQPRREYQPWRNRRQRTPRILYYSERAGDLIAAITIWNIVTFVLTVFGLLAFIYYIFKPNFLVSFMQKRSQEVIVSSSISSWTTPQYRPNGFLPLTEADELCGIYNISRWNDRSKPRKVYEIIYIDSTNPEYRNELYDHIGQRNLDVDYFILASAEDSFRIEIGRDWINELSGSLWWYLDKIIPHFIQAATKVQDSPPRVLSQPFRLSSEPVTNIYCERKSKQGDTIHIHYNVTFEDGTLIGSTYGRYDIDLPISYTIGAGSLVGWDEGVRGMCAGQQRVIPLPPELGYGTNATGPIPANSTLIFHVQLAAILDEPDSYERDGHHYSVDNVKDPLLYEHRLYTYNSMYQALPLLTGVKKPSEGDIILISTPDQIPTSRVISILRNCNIPPHTTIISFLDGGHYQGHANRKISSQIATLYAGEQTVLPADIRGFSRKSTAKNTLTIIEERLHCEICDGASPVSGLSEYSK